MTQAELCSLVEAHARRNSPGVQLDPITLIVIGAIISSVIGHYAEKCLGRFEAAELRNPTFVQRRQLQLAVALACATPAVRDAARSTGLGAFGLYRKYGGLVHAGFLSAAREIGGKGRALMIAC